MRIWLALCGLLLAQRAWAGPWVPAPGRFYLELRGSFATTVESFDPSGSRRPLRIDDRAGALRPVRLYDGQAQLYAEVGLATRLALVAELGLVRGLSVRDEGPVRGATGVGDLRAGLRLLLVDEEVACALEVRVAAPTARSDGDVPLGPGDLRGEAVLSVGHVWDRVPVFLVGELGVRLRSSGTQRAPVVALSATQTRINVDYASEITYAVLLGYRVSVGASGGPSGGRYLITPSLALDGRHGFTAPRPGPAGNLIDPLSPASVRLLRLGGALAFGFPAGSQTGRPMRIEIAVSGGAFVWGEGLPAIGELALALGVAR